MDRVHLGGRSACWRDAAALSRNDWSWIGGAGCVFFRKSFVVRSIRVSTMGLKHESQLGPRLAMPRPAKESATPSLFSQLHRSG
jgi:hypothetical protein